MGCDSLLSGLKGTQSWRKQCITEVRQVTWVVPRTDLIIGRRRNVVLKETGKQQGSPGQKGWRYGVTAWQKVEETVSDGHRAGKPRRGRNDVSFKGS